jgi:hypothetical protein
MNRRAFLGRALTVGAGAAAAVVAAPAMVTKVAPAEAAPAVLPSEPPEPTLVFAGGGEVVLDRFVTETREATSDVTLSEVWNGDQVTYSVEGETGPIYGVTFPNVNASPPSIASGWHIAPGLQWEPGAALPMLSGEVVSLNKRAFEPSLDRFLAHVEASALRWCGARGCDLNVVQTPYERLMKVRHLDDDSVAVLHVDTALPFYGLASEIARFELWLASQHAPSTVEPVRADVKRIMDTLTASVGHTHAGSDHSHGSSWVPIAHTHGGTWGGDVTTGGLPSGEHAVW